MDKRLYSRRRALQRTLLAAGATAVVMPSSWRKPVVDSLMLPAHAQGSIPVQFSAERITEASAESRTPSGAGSPVTALASISLSGCTGAASVAVSCVFDADLSGTTVPLGTGTTTTGATGEFTASISVPAVTVVDVSAISFITVTCSAEGVTHIVTLQPSSLSPALAGSAPAPAACRLL